MLPGHLEALQSQGCALSQIVVVDNASTDGTVEFVSKRYPNVNVIRLDKNEGVSGGYCAGLEYALERGYDWAWLLDQDSKPVPRTVEKLLAEYEAFPEPEKLGLIAPLPVDEETGEAYPLFLWEERQRKVFPELRGGGLTLVDMVISSGSLIRLDAVRKAGLPRRDFFMDFVDYEHCLRLRRNGFLIGVVKGCAMLHTIGHPRSVTFLGRQKSWLTHPAWRDYYKVRNRAFVVWQEFPSPKAKAFVVYQLLKQMAGSLLYDPQKITRIGLMWRGFWDGVKGRLGPTVQPKASLSGE
jgi:GT2 family glycosyltransferase